MTDRDGPVASDVLSERCVELRIPADPELRRVVRLAVSAVGSLVGLDVEQLADVRLAVDELCTIVARGALGECRLEVVVRWEEEQMVEVSCSASAVAPDKTEAPSSSGLDPGVLPLRILEALVDDFEINEPTAGTRQGWFRKSA